MIAFEKEDFYDVTDRTRKSAFSFVWCQIEYPCFSLC